MNYLAKPLNKYDVALHVICEQESTPLEECFSISDQRFINARLNSGKMWAWCRIKIIATWADYSDEQQLRCASFIDERDFRNDVNYKRLVNEAISNLNKKVAAAFNAVEFKLKT